MPARVASIRAAACRRCDAPCARYIAGEIDHAEPAESCPRSWAGHWGIYGRLGNYTRAGVAPAVPVSASAVPILTKARHLVTALVRWIKAGLPTADKRRRARLKAICEACPMWKPSGNLGFGECRDPRCGCSRWKRFLKTETCPCGKWPK